MGIVELQRLFKVNTHWGFDTSVPVSECGGPILSAQCLAATQGGQELPWERLEEPTSVTGVVMQCVRALSQPWELQQYGLPLSAGIICK